MPVFADVFRLSIDWTSPQLCLVTDPMLSQERLEEALAAGVTLVQIRGHQLTSRQLYQQAEKFCQLCHVYHVPCVINDRVDIGLAAGVDGFQIGRQSLPLAVVRCLVGDSAVVGASVHSLEEAEQAVTSGASFLLAGTIFPSRTHPGEATNGPGFICEIRRSFPGYPVLAIGGINQANAEQVMRAGAAGIALISALLCAPDMTEAVRRLRAVIGLP